MIIDLLILAGLGLLGILFHNLIQLNKINKETDGNANIANYWKLEKYSILISVLMILGGVFCVEELNQLENFKEWKGFGFIAIGYMGQSLLVWVMGKAGNKVGKEDNV